MSIHWTDADDEELERWHAEAVADAGGPLFFHAKWKQVHDEWEQRARALCAESRTTNPRADE